MRYRWQQVRVLACALALAVLAGLSLSSPVPAVEGRVVPLPAGKWSWSANYGVAGPMWSSGHHTGQDFSAASGTPILAAADGAVVFTGDGGAYGNLTQIQHSGGVQTWYAHQSAIVVSVGMQVRAGQVIGAVGSTGNSTGPHLHFEVRLNGAHVDPRAWLGGAPAVAVDGSPIFDPVLATQLRGELAEAEAAQRLAKQRVAEIDVELAKLRKRNRKVAKAASAAHRVVLNQVRDVYKMGIDPQWLINIEAFDAGDWRTFADRRVISEYTSNYKSLALDQAFATLARAREHEEKVAGLQAEAAQTLAAATTKMTELEAKLGAGALAMTGTQFDGVVPAGGSPRAVAAVRFALSQVGSEYSSSGGTGPAYGCNGFTWRAWHEAGSDWPNQVADQQASNRNWVAPVAAGQEQVGDLVFWRIGNGTAAPGQIDHVGIVVNPEQGLFVHASSPRTGVEINNYRSSSYYRNVAMFGRVVR